MENSEKALTEQESLLLIGQMIRNAKKTVRENGFIFLLWGWLVMVASLSNYLMAFVLNLGEIAYLPWPVLMIAGGIITGIYSSRQSKKARVKTYIDDSMKFLWIAFGAALFFTLVYMSKVGPEVAYPFIMVLYGVGTFVSGGILKFKPLIWGGICCWVIAIAATYFDFQYQLLLLALSVLVSYIIPGHILKHRYQHEKV